MKKDRSQHGFLKYGTPESMMRLGFILCVAAACVVGVVGSLTITTAFLIMVITRDFSQSAGAIIGAVLGGIATVVGTLISPAFIGKAAQSFAELRRGPVQPLTAAQAHLPGAAPAEPATGHSEQSESVQEPHV